jgi:hypothetical protein
MILNNLLNKGIWLLFETVLSTQRGPNLKSLDLVSTNFCDYLEDQPNSTMLVRAKKVGCNGPKIR